MDTVKPVADADPQDELSQQDREWLTIGRPGYAGHSRSRRGVELDRLFGRGNWRIAYLWQGKSIDRDAALALYEEAYCRHFVANPDVLDWICDAASDVYDIAPSNVESRLDYHKQECDAVHLQDVAIRRCLARLNRSFQGNRLVQIRGHDSDGYRLNPGQVPFHDAEAILRPSPSSTSWWKENSIEDFWQSNKLLQVRSSVPEDLLKQSVMKELKPNRKKTPAVAVFGGSFNPIHNAHLQIALDLLDLFAFERVVFVPNGNGYRKRGLIDEVHRAEMIRLAIQDEHRFTLCEYELGRENVAYAAETIAHIATQLTDEFGRVQLYNIRGSDVIKRMLGWKSLPGLLEAIQIVPTRPGSDPWTAFGSEDRFRLHSDRFRMMYRDYEDGISSSLVRSRVKMGSSVRYLVPAAVDGYIRAEDLYR